MKQLEVTITGQSYILGCPEGGEAELMAAVAHVDREMSAIRDAGRVKARERIAVLAALNLAYALAHKPEGATLVDVSRYSAGPALPPDVDTLIARIDRALEGDGQLL